MPMSCMIYKGFKANNEVKQANKILKKIDPK